MFQFKPFYLRIARNSFEITNTTTGESRLFQSEQPFSSTRLLVADFGIAESLLTRAFKEMKASYGSVVVHPTEIIEGGVSMIEERIFQELALGAGARSVAIHTGNRPTNDQVLSLAKASSNKAFVKSYDEKRINGYVAAAIIIAVLIMVFSKAALG